MNNKRTSRGSVIPLVAAIALVLAMLMLAFTQLSLFLGAGREMRNTVDAGALSVGQQSFTTDTLKVSLQPVSAQSQFNDVLDKDGKVGLGNINEIWSKALLAEANADAMGNTGNSKTDADAMFDAAKQISDSLAQELVNSNNLYPLFDQIAQQNSLRMLGSKTQGQSDHDPANWQTSLMDRGKESNIQVTTSNILPSDTTYQALQVTNNCIPGYTPLTVGGRTFCFVPFTANERTHLVAGSDFQSNLPSTNPLNGPEWGVAVPNAFSCRSKSVNQQSYGLNSMAYVVANPQKTYRLSMPHSFVHIKIENNQAYWYFNGIETWTTSYGYTTDTQTEIGDGGYGTLTAESILLGTDVVGRTLDQIIFGPPASNTAQIETDLVQRANEVLSQPGSQVAASDIHSAMSDPATIGWLNAGFQDFYLFSPDGKTITVQPQTIALTMAPWLASTISNSPDGSEAQISDGMVPSGAFTPILTPGPYGNVAVPPFGWQEWHEQVYWQPGSGYDGCLGQMRVQRFTNVYSVGVAAPVI